MYSTAIGMFVGVYILGIQLGMGIVGVWLSIAIDLFVRAIFLFFMFTVYLVFYQSLHLILQLSFFIRLNT